MDKTILLKQKRRKLSDKYKIEAADQKRCKASMDRLSSQIAAIDKKLKVLHGDNIDITDHAIVRYYERVLGIDLNAVKRDILSEEQEQEVRKLGDCIIPLRDGFKLVIRNGAVVTITDEKGKR